VGIQKAGGDGDHVGWSGVWVEVVDRVDNGILVDSTCIGEGGYTTGTGVDGMGAGVGTGTGGADAGVREIGGG
jgi:hypothetical protein